MNRKTGKETTSIKAVCGICKHPKKGGDLDHDCWLVLDKPNADLTAELIEDPSLFHVQPEYYSVNHCGLVVDPANLATIPNASLGSLPTGIQAMPGTPAVVDGVHCTDTVVRGITHCTTNHSGALDLGEEPHFVIYEIKPSHPEYKNFLNTPTLGFFKCMGVVDISLAMVVAGNVVISRI